MSEFFDYVRGITDIVPKGYTAHGMAVYRHHVYLGVSQQLEASYPALKSTLNEEAWAMLLRDFIAKSHWTSHFYSDLSENFKQYLLVEVGDSREFRS